MMVSDTDQIVSVDVVDHMALEVGASSENLRMVRLVVSAFGTSHGADIDDLEDLRIAAGDLCTHVISDAPDGSRLKVSAAVLRSGVASVPTIGIHASVDRPDAPGDLDEISGLILGAATDAFDIVESTTSARPTWTEGSRDSGYGFRLVLEEADSSGTGHAASNNAGGATNGSASADRQSAADEAGLRRVNGWFSRALRGDQSGVEGERS